MLTFVQAKRRFEFTDPATGRIVFVIPLEGADVSDVDPRQVATVTPATAPLVENAKKLLAGDQAAGDTLDQQLDQENQTSTQLLTGQTQQQTGATDQGGMLPSPEYLNEILNGIQTAVNLEDGRQKLAITEQQVRGETARLWGLNNPYAPNIDAMLAAGADVPGPLPTTPQAISELAATNPAYLAVFNRIGGMPAAIELNRRGNALARVQALNEDRGRAVDLNTRVSDIQRQMDEVRLQAKRAEEDFEPSGGASANPWKDQRTLNRLVEDRDRTLADLQDEMNRLIEAERPGWTQWWNEGKELQSFMESSAVRGQPQDVRDAQIAAFQRGDARNPTTGRVSTARGAIQQPTYGGQPIDNRQQAAIFAGAQPPPSGDQPPGPAPEGQRWVKENGVWVLKPKEQADQAQPPDRFAPGAFAGIPGFAEGGVFQGSAFRPQVPGGQQPRPLNAGIVAPGDGAGTMANAADAGLAAQAQRLQEETQRQLAAINQERATALAQIAQEVRQTLASLDQQELGINQQFEAQRTALTQANQARKAQMQFELPERQEQVWRSRGLLPMPVAGGI